MIIVWLLAVLWIACGSYMAWDIVRQRLDYSIGGLFLFSLVLGPVYVLHRLMDGEK